MGACADEHLARTVVCGEGVTCAGFGGEGTGRKSMLDTDALPVSHQLSSAGVTQRFEYSRMSSRGGPRTSIIIAGSSSVQAPCGTPAGA